jgi:uncharacterized membrane protein YheB (UPF0754 family)
MPPTSQSNRKLPVHVVGFNQNISYISSRLRLLKLIPYLLCIVLILSFFLSTDGVTIDIWGYQLHFGGILRIISISGLIGFLTNWIAITMLFRPIKPRPVFGQGLIPAQKVIIAEKLANTVNKNLINTSIIRERLINSGILSNLLDSAESSIYELSESQDFREYLYQSVADGIRDVLSDVHVREKFAERILLEFEQSLHDKGLERIAFKAYKQLRGNEAAEILSRTLEQVPDILYDNRHNFDDIIEGLPSRVKNKRSDLEQYLLASLEKLLDHIDVKSIVKNNLNNYDEGRLENLIKESTFEQLNYIKYLGAVLGMIGGLFIWNSIAALILVVPIILILLILDTLLSKLRVH